LKEEEWLDIREIRGAKNPIKGIERTISETIVNLCLESHKGN